MQVAMCLARCSWTWSQEQWTPCVPGRLGRSSGQTTSSLDRRAQEHSAAQSKHKAAGLCLHRRRHRLKVLQALQWAVWSVAGRVSRGHLGCLLTDQDRHSARAKPGNRALEAVERTELQSTICSVPAVTGHTSRHSLPKTKSPFRVPEAPPYLGSGRKRADRRGQQLGKGALHGGRGADRLGAGHRAEGGGGLRLPAGCAALPARCQCVHAL